MFIDGSVHACSSSMGVLCTCVVSQFTFVSGLCSSMGECTYVVSQFALVDCIFRCE